ncbi:MAG: 2-succinyl-5-enolpyruvyl-6-hydroxy-3-cyclohexene-1-carboxylic-acid synthase [Chloroflexi bacterium]|nr:MAG: 2-succinyl-5-enolpyruvyl-6-hydroxy-3-cyclohexene-1-carboxylic-acid synthase [Chloroflexota bacterium]
MPIPADRYVHALLQSLRHAGVRHIVIAPGSRNTPITVAVTAPTSPFRTWLHLDERSAGYFALGLARQIGEPVAVLCTSGTAAANFLPAAVEARLSRIPLIFLTADRPPEARDIGAAQTVDQVGLFGSHVKWAVDMPPADESAARELERYARVTAARAAAIALEAPRGPVHLNVPFREPLVEADAMPPVVLDGPLLAHPAHAAVAADVIAHLGEVCAGKRGLIVCGPESAGLPAAAIVALGSALDWPVIADPLSGLRAGPHDRSNVIDCADVIVRAPEALRALPEVVLRFGAAPTSKPFNQWLAGQQGVRRILVEEGGVATAGWRDPDLQGDEVVPAAPEDLCRALTAALTSASAPSGWCALWRAANAAAREAMREAIAAFDDTFEGQAVIDLRAALPAGSTLVAGNSMPVRDIDSFFFNTESDIRIVGTRGASGIDGVTSTAVGAAAVGGGPVALLIGDLSFLHDVNGLWPTHRYDLNLTIVLVNNQGGGIFSFLPQRQAVPDRFDAWWGTPHGVDLRHAVALHHGRHAVLDAGDQQTAIAAALARPGLDVLELRTERDRNVAQHNIVWARAIEAVRGALAAHA